MDENMIVVLETGCGKTLIAILLMCHMRHLIKKPQTNLCIFLAPTVVLQAKVIQRFTDFKVGVYSGDAKHLRTHIAWERELQKCEVLVMTPQLLLHSLCHCFIRMENVSLLIFDECHYAQLESNHPYAEIMKVFYDANAPKMPRIFGMTASPICGKGASVNSLQTQLHAKVYTVNNNNELETVVVSPVVQVYHYTSNTKLSSSSLHRCLDKLEEIRRKACRIRLKGDNCERNEVTEARGTVSSDLIQNEYLAQTATLLDTECRGDGNAADLSCVELLKEPYFSQKVLCLVGILSNFRSRPDMKCIIFVNRIIIARSLAYLLGQTKILSAWKCDFLVGVHSGLKSMSRKTMTHILEEFRSGKLNLLVATKVGEEGLDIQTCCLVIRFDLPETLASFIQSRGRARMPQSEYAFLVDSENEREMKLMDSFGKGEERMNMDIRNRKPNVEVAKIKEDVYSVGFTGATISTQTSISLLYHYCSKLPRDEYFIPKPDLFYVDDTEGTICHIILPSNAPIHHVVSTAQSSVDAAKRNACLRACKELHEIGALTEYLLPEQDDSNEEATLDITDSDSTGDEDSSFELQEMLVPATLKEPWTNVEYPVCLNSYFIRFIPKPDDRQYKDFGLFLKAPLPLDAKRLKIDLHLAHGRSVLSDLVPSGLVEFSEEEMLLAQNFQEVCLKVVLDRTDLICDHVPLRGFEVSELHASKFYLLLPVIWQEIENRSPVDWITIRRCLSSPIFTPTAHLAESRISSEDHLYLADGPASVNVILNSLVYVGHKKSFFFVSQILADRNGYSLHNSTMSHVEHMSEKFGIHLAHPEQPLLQAKQLFCLHNLLLDRKKGNIALHELEEHFFELPPELCELKVIGFSKDIGSSLSLLPSIMHRLENLLVAIELKDMLSRSFVEGGLVTAERVLEALTTEKCHERFSLERLEVLGDAFLKFVVGRHLFLKYGAYDEGQLTRRRSNLVNNSNLHKLATRNNLQVYVRDQAFDANQIFTLGRPCSIICTKQTETSIHHNSEYNLTHGFDTRQVRCSRNHHWLSKKTIADVIEALVGAYLVDSGFKAAIAFLRWIGIDVEFEVSQVCRAWTESASFMSLADRIDFENIEGILGHQFAHRGLLLQAFVHPSYNRHRGGCYQRLEFLGDAVLDYLITSYLYSVFPDLKPGQFTDLRSSLVNNRTFARIAANALYTYIMCENSNLCDAIDKFVNFIRMPASEKDLLEEPPCPKVAAQSPFLYVISCFGPLIPQALGDLVESCIGAILLDAGFDLNHVWKLVLSFLDPVMRFSNLQLSPIREVLELCQHHGWKVKFLPSKKGKNFMVEAVVQGENLSAAASAINRNKRTAKKMASQLVTAKLKAQGYKLKTKSLEEVLKTLRRRDAMLVGYDEMPLARVSSSGHSIPSGNHLHELKSLCLEDRQNDCMTLKNEHQELKSVCTSPKKSPEAPSPLPKRWQHNQHIEDGNCSIEGGSRQKTAKARLNEICVAKCWAPPSYECCREEGPSHLKLFMFKVVVVIEEAQVVMLECVGQCQAKKKEAAEEAAKGALWYLTKEGYILN
ncbi:hypothetical protein KSS87_008418 [Heliosperma pusillum]|nr:hypothetical protein KSS87_008418 [Heliosperma pusillum]